MVAGESNTSKPDDAGIRFDGGLGEMKKFELVIHIIQPLGGCKIKV